MTGRDFVTCAEQFGQGSSEAELRSAVSRAYYGAFHEAVSLLNDCGVWLPKTEQVHVEVGYCLRDCGNAEAAKAGQQLEVLRSQRKVADYDLDDNRFNASRTAGLEIARARRFLAVRRRVPLGTMADFRARSRSHAKLLGLTVSD